MPRLLGVPLRDRPPAVADPATEPTGESLRYEGTYDTHRGAAARGRSDLAQGVWKTDSQDGRLAAGRAGVLAGDRDAARRTCRSPRGCSTRGSALHGLSRPARGAAPHRRTVRHLLGRPAPRHPGRRPRVSPGAARLDRREGLDPGEAAADHVAAERRRAGVHAGGLGAACRNHGRGPAANNDVTPARISAERDDDADRVARDACRERRRSALGAIEELRRRARGAVRPPGAGAVADARDARIDSRASVRRAARPRGPAEAAARD